MGKLKTAILMAKAGVRILARALLQLSAVMILVMMLIICVEVVLRYFLRSSLLWSFEVTEYMLVAVVFLGLGYVQVQKAHIRMTLLSARLGPRAKALTDMVIYVAGILLFGMVTWKGWQLAYHSFEGGVTSAGVIALPLFPSQLLVPIGSFLLCLQFLIDLFDSISHLKQQFSPLAKDEA